MDSQRFTLEKSVLADTPIWQILPEAVPEPPLVILQHGYTGNKESGLNFGLQLAMRGYHVVLPDARLHGDRRTPDFEMRFQEDFRRNFLEVIEGTAKDISTLIDLLGKGPVGMVGISMGAFITYMTLTHDKRVEAAVPLIGAPDFVWPGQASSDEAFETRVAEMNPASHLERFFPCAILIQHGELDELVPIDPDRTLYERLKPRYEASPERLEFIAYPGVAHEITQEMVAATVRWLERYLPVP